MVSIKAIFVNKGGRSEQSLDKWFIASESPVYIGIITKPSPGIWEYLTQSREVVLEFDGKSHGFTVPYRIEVGESSIFFVTPREEFSLSQML